MDKFLGFRGRIPRGRWWSGVVTLGFVAMAMFLGIAFYFGLPLSKLIGLGDTSAAALKALREASLLIGVIVLIATIYPFLSLSAQRLNDRGRPAALAWLLAVPAVLNIAAGLAGLDLAFAAADGAQFPQPTGIGLGLAAVSGLIGLWAVIELGCVRGTRGRNRHGPDPLER